MGILDGKVAIVTGAGKGLGVGTALALAKEGASVTVLARTFSDVAETAKKIEAIGGHALALKCDVGNRADVFDAVEKTVKKFGTVDIMVNNAQTYYDVHPMETWTDEELRVTWESGFMGSWYFMLACFPYMKEKRKGKIINFCSVAGHGRISGLLGYGAAKEAIRSLTRSGAREWGQYNINVNVVSPVASSAASDFVFDTDEKREAMFTMLGSALRRLGDAEKDVGRSVVFLAGPDSDHITGQTLGVDGGSAML